ncbi:MFS-type efflux pump MFS1 [Pseudocercospora fuligena]|uniref:MFS-type efflux pump MFS1 n=1 Tax=Pseudocercospora fuligena TaxID=685502 RepID=A0A8H6RJ70_9PEZI|nr:MFS-type efflux pump MFS1 [Pseudocercospora fuligena]
MWSLVPRLKERPSCLEPCITSTSKMIHQNSHDEEKAQNAFAVPEASRSTEYNTETSNDSTEIVEGIDSKGSATSPDQPVNDEAEPKYVAGACLALTLIAAAMSVFLVSLDSTIISTAIPDIVDEFHHLDHVVWYGSAYMLGMATTQAFWGKAYSCWSLKYVFLLALCIFEIGTAICTLAPNSAVFVLGRSIGGTGGAGVAAGTFLIIAVSVPPRERPMKLGMLSICFVLAAVAGPLAGGALTTHVSWRACFYAGLPVGGISLLSILFLFTTPSHAAPAKSSLRHKLLQLDFAGMLTTVAFGACLVLALQWAGVTKSWSSSPVIGSLVGAGLAISILICVEAWLGDTAGLSGRLMRQKTIALQLVFNLSVSGTYYIVLYYLPVYFQMVKGADAAHSGLRTLALVGTSAPVAIISGIILSKTGEYQPIMIASAIFTTIGSGLIFTLGPSSTTLACIGYQIIVGIGLGLSIQLSIVVCQNVVQAFDLTRANTLALWTQLLGGATVLAVAQSAVSNGLLVALPAHAPAVSPASVILAGPADLRRQLDPDQLQGVTRAYMLGLKNAFGLALGLSCVGVVVALTVIIIDRRKLSDKLVYSEKSKLSSASPSTETLC